MKFGEAEYLARLQDILREGEDINDERTGVGTIALTNQVIEHGDIEKSFPLLVTKRVPFKVMAGELLWFLEGSTDDARLAAITYKDPKKRTIWTDNYDAPKWQARLEERWPGQKDSFMGYAYANNVDGDLLCAPTRWLGAIYGAQWREGFGVDQIHNLIEGIKKDPSGRRHIVSAWDPGKLNNMALPPCHLMFQCNVIGDRIDLAWFQRSGDMFLGIPFNLASYALLLKIIARETGLRARKVTGFIGNAHIYKNHVVQVREQLSRRDSQEYADIQDAYDADLIRRFGFTPDLHSIQVSISNRPMEELTVDDFTVSGYNPLPTIKAEMAV